MRKQYFLLVFVMLFSITNFAQKNSKSAADKNIAVFFKTFQSAVESGDKNKIKALCDFTFMEEGGFDDYFRYMLSGEIKDKIVKAKRKDLKKADFQEFEGIDNAKDFYILNFYESSTSDDGEFYESSFVFYFAKIKGSYRLFNMIAGG
jgi:hypothetical protein